MPKYCCFSFFLMAFLLSCSPENETRQEFVSYNTFNIQPKALQEGDSLRLVYASSFNDKNDTFMYLIHVVAIKLSTKDTVNILCTHTDQLKATDGDKVFRFEVMDEVKLDIIVSSDSLIKELFKDDSINLTTLAEGKWKMVIRDPQYREFDNKNYPTVFGELKD